ncbi:hypothetical protein ABPG75_001835 [Micractinium tetrahymenae]
MPLPATIPLPGGLAMPAVGLGTFKSRGQEAAGAVAAALTAGFRHIDTASIYKNESEVAAGIAASGVPRHEVFVTSKVSPYQMGSEAAIAACEASLAALQCTQSSSGSSGSRAGSSTAAPAPIDLMLVHWPGVAKTPADSPANAAARQQTWRVLESFHRRGLFRAIGVSNFEVRHLEELLSYAEVAPATNQVEIHPRYQQRQLRAYCAEHGIPVVAYSPFGGGVLLDDPAVAAAAAAAGVSPAQALLLWGLHRGAAVLPKSVRSERIAEVAPAELAAAEAALGEAGLARLLAALDALGEEEAPVKYCWDPSGIA